MFRQQKGFCLYEITERTVVQSRDTAHFSMLFSVENNLLKKFEKSDFDA